MKSTLKYRLCTAQEAPKVVDFLTELGPELYLNKRAVAAEMVDLLFTHGRVVAGFAQHDDGERLVALIGYFWRDPNNDFADEETNTYTNMPYSKFAMPLKKEKNRRGITCILYGNSVAAVIDYLRRGPSHRTKRTAAQLIGATPWIP